MKKVRFREAILFTITHTDFNCLIYSPISVVHIFQFLLVKRFAVSKLEPMFALGFIRVHFCGLPTSCPTRKSLLRPAKSWGNLGKLNWTLNAIWNQCEEEVYLSISTKNYFFILIGRYIVLAICSPNSVQIWKGRDRKTVFLQGET